MNDMFARARHEQLTRLVLSTYYSELVQKSSSLATYRLNDVSISHVSLVNTSR